MQEAASIQVPNAARQRAIVFLALAAGVLWVPVASALFGTPPPFLRNLGFLSGPGGTPLAWIVGLLVALAYSGFAVTNIPLVRENCCALSRTKLLAIAAAFAAAIVEEAFFRRLIMDGLLAAGASAVGQILASGLAFGLAHGVWGIASGRMTAGLGAAVATGILGAALGVVYVVGERSLAPVIVSHFVITVVIQPGILYAAFSGQMPRPQAGWWRGRG